SHVDLRVDSCLATDQTGRRFSEADIDSSPSTCSAHDNSCNFDGANLYGARATGAAPGTKSI
ncbi:hypothetical protein Tco_0160396, partial [Tanacetum coccineum]